MLLASEKLTPEVAFDGDFIVRFNDTDFIHNILHYMYVAHMWSLPSGILTRIQLVNDVKPIFCEIYTTYSKIYTLSWMYMHTHV